MNKILVLVLAFMVLKGPGAAAAEDAMKRIELRSPAFGNGDMIPVEHTCDGTNVSPALEWSVVPAGAQSLALISDDPDAPVGNWVHWVLYDLPPGLTGLPAGVPPGDRVPGGGTQGRTDFGSTGYGGPCPPSGTHRYFFKLFALDTVLNLGPGATKEQLEKVMRGHVMGLGELMGRYQRD